MTLLNTEEILECGSVNETYQIKRELKRLHNFDIDPALLTKFYIYFHILIRKGRFEDKLECDTLTERVERIIKRCVTRIDNEIRRLNFTETEIDRLYWYLYKVTSSKQIIPIESQMRLRLEVNALKPLATTLKQELYDIRLLINLLEAFRIEFKQCFRSMNIRWCEPLKERLKRCRTRLVHYD